MFCQRFAVAKEIEEKNPGVTVKHKCFLPFATKVSVNGQSGDTNCCVGKFFCPCMKEEKSALQAEQLLSPAAAFDMIR